MPLFSPGHISLFFIEDGRKKMHAHPRSLDKCHLKLSFTVFNLWRRKRHHVVFLFGVEVGRHFHAMSDKEHMITAV